MSAELFAAWLAMLNLMKLYLLLPTPAEFRFYPKILLQIEGRHTTDMATNKNVILLANKKKRYVPGPYSLKTSGSQK